MEEAGKSPFFFWRSTARAVECRWRQRLKKLRAITNEPQHPADEQDETVAGDVDSIAARQTAANDIRSFLSNAPPGNRAQQSSAKKPKDTNNVPVNRVDNPKKQKQRKGRKKLKTRERNAAETAKMQVEGFVTFWHGGKCHRVAK